MPEIALAGWNCSKTISNLIVLKIFKQISFSSRHFEIQNGRQNFSGSSKMVIDAGIRFRWMQLVENDTKCNKDFGT